MLFYKNRLIIGAISKFFKTVSTFIYKILKTFRLHLTLLVILTGIILFFCGVFEDNATAEMIYFIVLIASVFYAVIGTVRAILFPKPKEEKKRAKVDIVKKEETEEEKAEQTDKEKPVFYKVKQNNSYIMAEYKDRYELFVKTPEGLKRVRTDYKEKQSEN